MHHSQLNGAGAGWELPARGPGGSGQKPTDWRAFQGPAVDLGQSFFPRKSRKNHHIQPLPLPSRRHDGRLAFEPVSAPKAGLRIKPGFIEEEDRGPVFTGLPAQLRIRVLHPGPHGQGIALIRSP